MDTSDIVDMIHIPSEVENTQRLGMHSKVSWDLVALNKHRTIDAGHITI